MLSVKRVEKSGDEWITECTSVSFYPRGSEETGRPMLVAYGIKHPAMKEGIGWGAIDKDGTCRFGDGRVFVMNENGRTVGNYDLEELSVPKSMISGSRTSSSRDPGNDLNTFQKGR